MKHRIFAALAVLLMIPAVVPSSAKTLEEIVIKVNDAIVTKTEYETRLKQTEMGLKREYKGPDLSKKLKELPQQLIEQMEDELLLVEKAKQLYKVSDIVDYQVKEFMKENHIKTKEELAKALAQEGVSMDQFRKQMELIYIPEFMKSREIRSKISISTDEIKDYYAKHKDELASKGKVELREILLLKDNYNQEQADKIYQQIKAAYDSGTPFGDLAVKYSQAFTRTKKGEAGWFEESDLAKNLGKAVFNTKEGQITRLLPTNAGWYVFQVEKRTHPKVPTMDEARDAIVGILKNQKFQTAYHKYIEKLKAENYVWLNPKYV